jgi:ribosome biogenesis SPOUT family RNA methylase Rps3
MMSQRFSFVVEHLDPELGQWSSLEYQTISKETKSAGSTFILSSVPAELISSGKLAGFVEDVRSEAVEQYMAGRLDRICLLDPAAKQELSPSDGDRFDIFLFGGILGEFSSDISQYKANRQQEMILLEVAHTFRYQDGTDKVQIAQASSGRRGLRAGGLGRCK